MLSRFALAVFTLFWVVMNLLLWRAEYGATTSAGAAVPAAVIWQKMLTAPDTSSLAVYHHGRKIGFCHWMTSVGEELARLNDEDAAPEGLLERVSGYRIQLDGNLMLENSAPRIRFDGSLKLATNHLWQEFSARLIFKGAAGPRGEGFPGTQESLSEALEIRSLNAEQTLHLKAQTGDLTFERALPFSELQSPGALLSEFAGPLAYQILSGITWPGGARNNAPLPLGLKWEANNDSILIGHSRVRVFRLQTRFLDYKAVLFVSRVGEILRVELPHEVLLLNDQLASF
jgi:hypothetical protein